MAPGGRGRKMGLSRMDAAIDAAKEMDFPAPLVRKTVKDLLKDDNVPQNEAADGDNAEPSSLAEKSPVQELPGPNEEPAAKVADMEFNLPPSAEGDLSGWKDFLPDMSFKEAQREDVGPDTLCGSNQKDDDQEEKINRPEVSPIISSFKTKRRRPCYGWLDAETDEAEILILAPLHRGGAQGKE